CALPISEAPNVTQVIGKAAAFQRAAARPLLDDAVVVAFHVEQNPRRRRKESGEMKGVDLKLETGNFARMLDERQAVFEKVDVVGIDGLCAALTHAARLGQ